MELQQIKNKFEIIGNSPLLNHALATAIKVSVTDMSVLIYGESGVGKEVFSKIIHTNSKRKHGPFIAVNCGAIPEGTIDSELFGHEKGAFTGATDARKGYFESANSGTIFLDEVGELPLGTQARLLRVLESGEYMRVGSSKIQKTDVRIVAATNKNLLENANNGTFREDLYYRLATIPITIPKLSKRKEDIYLIFMKFVREFSEKYHIGYIELTEEAKLLLENYPWPGNIRQLRNVTEQICVLEKPGVLDVSHIQPYLPDIYSSLPALSNTDQHQKEPFSERDILYRVLFDLKKDMTELKKIVYNLIHSSEDPNQFYIENKQSIQHIFNDEDMLDEHPPLLPTIQKNTNIDFNPKEHIPNRNNNHEFNPTTIPVEETKTIHEQEKEMIIRSLERNKGKRKKAAQELGISERTLYRKINQYQIES
jgi:DNA-binding NtrC family response regulator